jgi:copper transport protein
MITRRLARFLAVAALVGAILIATAAPAWAHASLVSSNPADGATVATSPPALTLTFSEAVEIQLGSIQVSSCTGARVDVGPAHHTKSDSEIAATLPALTPGQYLVSWRVISADSHPVHGAYYFAVGAGGQANGGGCAAAPPSSHAPKIVGVLFGITRGALFAGLALLIGGMVFLMAIARGTSAARRCRTVVWVGWFLILGATVFGVMLQGPYADAGPLSDAFKSDIVRDILKTRYGHVAELRLLFLALALPLIFWERRMSTRGRPNPVWVVLASIVGLLLAATPGLAGHAATGDWVVLGVPFDTIHVVAMSIWLGGLVALLVSAIGGGFSGGLRRALVRFSTIALVCVIVLFATGLFASWRQVGFSIKGYFDTSFGNILLVKIGLVIVMVGLAAISRSIVQKRRSAPLDAPDSAIAAIDERTVGKLRRSVGGEVLIGVVVLAVTALLVQAQPARSALTPQRFVGEATTADGKMKIDLTIDPARTGPNAIHIYTLNPDNTNVTIQKITADMTKPGQDTLSVPLTRGGPNHFLNNGFPIPAEGKWKIAIHARKSQFDDNAVVFDVPIRGK